MGNLIIGLLQVTEYAENLRPAGMVSFIHKSLQEFLAAWYITYRCVPEGNLGGIEEHVLTLDDGETWENVFQFICGLSNDGAVKVLEHLTSVRISDPTLDLSQTIPDVENETDVPLCDVTDEQWRFSNLVYNFFQEVHCKAEFLRHCFDCTGGFVLVTKRLTKLLQKVKAKDVTQDTHSGVFFYVEQTFNLSVFDNNPREKADSMLDDLIEVLDCLNVPLRITKSSDVLTVGDFLRKFKVNIGCRPCISKSILCFCNGQVQFYITELNLFCDDHTRLFTETTDICVQSLSANLCSEHEQSCLKFLTSLQCYRLSDQTGKALGGVIRNCKHLNSIKVQGSGDSVCDLLDQVVNPSKCSLEIGVDILSGRCALTSAGAVKLARLLPRFNNIIYLYLNLSDCCTAAVDTLVPNITHKTLRRLELSGISLTPAAVAALGRSLPEMSSLQALKLTRVDGSIVQAEEMEALFDGFNKTLPLCNLTFSGFSVSSCLAPLTKSLRFFPYLRELDLDKLNMDERDLRGLLESLRFIPNLEILRLDCTPLSHAHCCTAEVNTAAGFTHKTLRRLELSGISLNPAVVAALGQSLPEMPSLQTLMLTRMDGSILQGEEMEALFRGFNKTLPLCNLTFSGFSVSGCLAPLTKSLRFFPNLSELYLDELNTDEHNLCHLLESLRFTPKLKILVVQGKPLSHAHCCTAEVNTAAGFTHKTLERLVLSGISLTPAVAATLGRSLPEMSSLQTLKLTGANGSIFQAMKWRRCLADLTKPCLCAILLSVVSAELVVLLHSPKASASFPI
ncbi:Leucine-rich repeat-containing protein 31 [Desmophyllum pertusum]|uniref:Leucine-rich repeat-containing protein 31 n=1 Tax=Desmophyllum pertusum TaxID=174260 RepID=A0A9W9ZJ54_9CNID|nr:Leucine-rich repeat-containing protein 31 [Desmophyllum pertusum]